MTERLEAGVNRNLSGEVIPLDYGLAHEPIRKGGEPGHSGHHGTSRIGLVLNQFALHSSDDLPRLIKKLRSEGSGHRLKGYGDADTLFDAMLEWLDQVAEAAMYLMCKSAATGNPGLQGIGSLI